MKPRELVVQAETAFDEGVAEAMAGFEKCQDTKSWEDALAALRAIASSVMTMARRIAGHAGVAARQIRREEVRREKEQRLYGSDGDHGPGAV